MLYKELLKSKCIVTGIIVIVCIGTYIKTIQYCSYRIYYTKPFVRDNAVILDLQILE